MIDLRNGNVWGFPTLSMRRIPTRARAARRKPRIHFCSANSHSPTSIRLALHSDAGHINLRETSARSSAFFPGIQLLDLVERNTKCEAALTFRLEIRERSSVRRSRRAQNGNSPFADRTCVANARDLVLQR